MVTDPLDDWKTQAEAAEILKCSQKTIGRMAAQKKIQRVLRRVPGRKPMPVFNPDDIEAIRAEMVQVDPFPVKERGEVKALARQTSQGGVDLLAQLLADRISPTLAVPVEQKVFLNLKEAAAYSGLPKAWLMREIKSGKIKAIKAGGWRIRPGGIGTTLVGITTVGAPPPVALSEPHRRISHVNLRQTCSLAYPRHDRGISPQKKGRHSLGRTQSHGSVRIIQRSRKGQSQPT